MDTSARFKWRNAYRAGRVAAFVHRREAEHRNRRVVSAILAVVPSIKLALAVKEALNADDSLARKPSRLYSNHPGSSILRRIYRRKCGDV